MTPAISRLRDENGRSIVGIVQIGKAPPCDVDRGRLGRRNTGIDGDHGALMFCITENFVISAEDYGRAPGHATVQRAPEQDYGKLVGSAANKTCGGDVDRSRWDCLRDRLSVLIDGKSARGIAARNVDCQPGLIEENVGSALADDLCVYVLDTVARRKSCHRTILKRGAAVFFIVEVDEPRNEHGAQRLRAAIVSNTRVIEESVCAGTHGRIRGRLKAMDGRSQSLAGPIQRESGQQRTLPSPAGIEGLEE